MPTAPQPTAKPPRRWYQFSLRGLLIGTAVVGAFLGVGLRWIGPAERQRAGVDWLQRNGGDVRYGDIAVGESWLVQKLRDWLPRDYFDAVESLSLSDNPSTTDADVVWIGELKELNGLMLGWTQITDAGMAHLERLTQLQKLMLYHTQITDAGLAHLEGLEELQLLYLDDTRVTDAGLVHLEGLTQLQHLSLNETQITDAGLVHLTHLTQLQRIELERTEVTGTGVAELQKALPYCIITYSHPGALAQIDERPAQPLKVDPPVRSDLDVIRALNLPDAALIKALHERMEWDLLTNLGVVTDQDGLRSNKFSAKILVFHRAYQLRGNQRHVFVYDHSLHSIPGHQPETMILCDESHRVLAWEEVGGSTMFEGATFEDCGEEGPVVRLTREHYHTVLHPRRGIYAFSLADDKITPLPKVEWLYKDDAERTLYDQMRKDRLPPQPDAQAASSQIMTILRDMPAWPDVDGEDSEGDTALIEQAVARIAMHQTKDIRLAVMNLDAKHKNDASEMNLKLFVLNRYLFALPPSMKRSSLHYPWLTANEWVHVPVDRQPDDKDDQEDVSIRWPWMEADDGKWKFRPGNSAVMHIGHPYVALEVFDYSERVFGRRGIKTVGGKGR